MKRGISILVILYLYTATMAQKCEYWRSRVDLRYADTQLEVDEKDPRNILRGIECLLAEQGNQRPSFLIRSQVHISDMLPVPTVEVSALYYISFLFNGDHTFAEAVALSDDPPKFFGDPPQLKYNSKATIGRAFRSYRKWFRNVKQVGLDRARRLNLDPLDGSGVQWK